LIDQIDQTDQRDETNEINEMDDFCPINQSTYQLLLPRSGIARGPTPCLLRLSPNQPIINEVIKQVA
jgi:hypothetical protein